MLQLRNLSISYDDNQVVQDFSWQLDKGEIGCLLGQSGSGKTSILKTLAGFKAPASGEVRIHDALIANASFQAPPETRKIGMMFQDLALFPHLNVFKNIAFGIHQFPADKQKQRVDELLQLVDLEGKAGAAIHELSGGQQQRVALARALAPKPDIILLDEPFSSLDKDLRESLSVQVRDILKDQNTTGLLVTHDHFEAFSMADKIAILKSGRLEQQGTPFEVYHRPQTKEIASFLGICDFLPGTVNTENEIETVLGSFKVSADSHQTDEVGAGAKLEVLLRPDDIIHDDDSKQKATILSRQFKGAQFLFELDFQGQILHCYASAHHNHKPGDTIGFRLDMQHCIAFASV